MQANVESWSLARFKLWCKQHKRCKIHPACMFCNKYFPTAPEKWEEVDTTEEEKKQEKRRIARCNTSKKQ